MTQDVHETDHYVDPDSDDLNFDVNPDELAEATRAIEAELVLEPDELSTDLLQIFLRDVAKFSLLTAPQEVELAKRKDAGDKKAADLLALHNLRMVISVANRYHRGKKNQGIGYLDLIQEGMLGLLRAVELYDHRKNYRFSTYAMWWIRQSVARGLAEKSRNIRVPMHIIDKLGKITAAEAELHLAFKREPTVKELAAHLNMKPANVAEILRGTQVPISIDEPMQDSKDDSGDTELGAALQDETTPSPHDVVSKQLDGQILVDTLSRLGPRSLSILEHRYGLNGKQELNLTDIGKIWGITYQRVRQIELELLNKLRSNADIQILRSYDG